MAKPGLREGDHVDIALGKEDRPGLADRVTGARQVEQHAALAKERRFARIEVFGLGPAQASSAEGDHPATPVGNGKDDAIAEKVVRPASVLGLDRQPHLERRRFVEPARLERRLEQVACIRREAQAKLPNRGRGEPPRREIVARAHTSPFLKLRLEPRRGAFNDVVQSCLLLGLCLAGGAAGRQWHARFLGQPLDRLDEGQALRLHDEVKDAAVRAAAEAVIKPLVRADREGRRLFVVKRAQRDMLAPALDQPDPAPDHFGQRDAAAHVVEEFRRKRH